MTPAGAPMVFVIQHDATLRRDPVAQTGMDFPNEVELRVYCHRQLKFPHLSPPENSPG
jgi:hypothetical protein